jgi:catechol 2,3-dioxygenase-like lactoylglutathione lyase family enzyme
MTLSLDHIVIQVADLEQTIADYRDLGFNVQRGGTHADGATHNALINFADGSYLELIAFLRPAPERRWWALGDKNGDGFVDFALLPHSTAEVIDAARTRGLSYQGPLPGGRARPDGARLKWQIGSPPSADLPFLCGDITPRALRVRETDEHGADVRIHANGATGVASISIAVSDLGQSLARYAALVGLDASPHPIIHLPGTGLRAARLALGATELVLLASGAASSGRTSRLDEQLAGRGEGPFGVSLRTAPGTPRGVLDLQRSHGAWYELVAS